MLDESPDFAERRYWDWSPLIAKKLYAQSDVDVASEEAKRPETGEARSDGAKGDAIAIAG